ncbi:hypothetical protein PAXINDRAFT_10141 [Paxillus involutus ATCC 200175]|nr:hypothetical protein PAXINDRAFT_10141 [Paxillus involutus ATCC 200175]
MTTQSVVSIKVHGHFIELVNPAIIAPSEHLGAEQREHIFNDSTWALSEVALQTAVAALWTKLDESKISLNAAALIGSTTSVPYKTAYDTQPFICQAGTDKLNGTKGKGVASDCPACSIPIKEGSVMPYGHPRPSHSSRHSRRYNQGYYQCSAMQLLCTALWRYNLKAHLDDRHSEYAHPGKPQGLPLPHEMYDIIFLTELEQEKVNIPLQPLFHNVQEKENVAPTNAHVQKRRLDSTTFAKAASSSSKAKQ